MYYNGCTTTKCTTPIHTTPHTHKHFTALLPGPPGWAGARGELLDFMVQGTINRGRHTDHPDGRHSIRTNQCPPPPSSPYFLQAGCPSCRPTNSVKALKANKHKKTKARFSRLLQHPAWKWREPILISELHKFVTNLLGHLPTYS